MGALRGLHAPCGLSISAYRCTHACMAIAAAAPALIDRVEPNWAIEQTVSTRARASSVSPGPSCPKSSTQRRGSTVRSSGTAPGRLSIPMIGRPSAAAHAVSDSVSGWWRTCW